MSGGSDEDLSTLAPEDLVALDGEPREGPRYAVLGPLGEGGMGEVVRVRDLVLNRTVARKVLRHGLAARTDARARFVRETQATAQLQHPGIVPVHDAGVLPDGRPWFTMREIRGRTLDEILREVHTASSPAGWATAASGWTFRQLVSAFLVVCRTVAYAHERGVVHRDLKPSNVMLGVHGEVQVLDWGLAKLAGAVDPENEPEEGIVVDPAASGERLTQFGSVAGTPAYMAPEQASGELEAVDRRSDVYALGAVLYELLSGRPPYSGRTALDVVMRVLSGPPEPLGGDAGPASFGHGLEPARAATGPPVPQALAEICERAMARQPAERFPTASELADRVQAWLDGATRRDQALGMVRRALALEPAVATRRAEAARLAAEGNAALEALPSWASEVDKGAGWALQDQAAALRRAADLEQLQVDRALHAALQVDPDLPEAHEALAVRYLERHAEAERAGDLERAARNEALLAHHAGRLPDGHPARDRALAWLQGEGTLSLVTEPAGLEVTLQRYETHGRRRHLGPGQPLGRTPLDAVTLPIGSYLCTVGGVRVPARLGRLQAWEATVTIPQDLGADEVFVPPGWCTLGGDPEALFALPARRLWVDGFVIQRFPVTLGAYLQFLDALIAAGRRDEALAHAPRERGTSPDDEGVLLVREGPDGLEPIGGAVWGTDLAQPVTMVSWRDAHAFASWLAETTGLQWRLPCELEWEKAARGDDARLFPWGDFGDPSWCHVHGSASEARVVRVGSYRVDESPYGVRDLGGGVRDWCAEVFAESGPPVRDGVVQVVPAEPATLTTLRVCRGGGWDDPLRFARCCSRPRNSEGFRDRLIGFRLARSVRP